jgi:hypothetical protein
MAYTYLHLFLAALSSVAAAQLDLVKRAGINTDDVLTDIVLFIASLGLFVIIYYMSPGPLKYVAFVVFIVVINTLLRKAFNRFGTNSLLINILTSMTSVYLALAAAALWDIDNYLHVGGYLMVSIIGLVLAQLGYSVAMVIGSPKKEEGLNYYICLAGTTIFALYTGYSAESIRAEAKKCKGNYDYINQALGFGFYISTAKRFVH